MLTVVKIVFRKKVYISDLCRYYGCPQDVRDHLLKIVNKFPFLLRILSKDIEKFDKDVEDEYNNWLSLQEEMDEIRNINKGGCYDCPQGNGEGGCTIPGYCVCDE